MTSSADEAGAPKRVEERLPPTIWDIVKFVFPPAGTKREKERRPATPPLPLVREGSRPWPSLKIQLSDTARKVLVMGILSALSIFALIYAFRASIPLDLPSYKTSAYSPPPGCIPGANLPDEVLTTLKVLANANPETFKDLIHLANIVRNAQCDALKRKNVSPDGPSKPKQPSGPDNPKQPSGSDKSKQSVTVWNFCKGPVDGGEPQKLPGRCIPLNIDSKTLYLPTDWIWKLPVIAYGTMRYLQPENRASDKEMVCNFISDMEKYMVPVISELCPRAPDNNLPTIVETALGRGDPMH